MERVGRVVVTYGTLKGDLLQAALVDLSTRGARIHAQRDLDPGSSCRWAPCWSSPSPWARRSTSRPGARSGTWGRASIGLEFSPPLAPEVAEPLSRWVFQRREEDLERLARRREVQPPGTTPAARVRGAPPGILFVSGDPELEEALRDLFRPSSRWHRIAPVGPGPEGRPGRGPAPGHLPGERHRPGRAPPRSRPWWSWPAAKVPVLLLGTQVDGATLFELAGEWKAASAMVWNPARGLVPAAPGPGHHPAADPGRDAPLAPQEG